MWFGWGRSDLHTYTGAFFSPSVHRYIPVERDIIGDRLLICGMQHKHQLYYTPISRRMPHFHRPRAGVPSSPGKSQRSVLRLYATCPCASLTLDSRGGSCETIYLQPYIYACNFSAVLISRVRHIHHRPTSPEMPARKLPCREKQYVASPSWLRVGIPERSRSHKLI